MKNQPNISPSSLKKLSLSSPSHTPSSSRVSSRSISPSSQLFTDIKSNLFHDEFSDEDDVIDVSIINLDLEKILMNDESYDPFDKILSEVEDILDDCNLDNIPSAKTSSISSSSSSNITSSLLTLSSSSAKNSTISSPFSSSPLLTLQNPKVEKKIITDSPYLTPSQSFYSPSPSPLITPTNLSSNNSNNLSSRSIKSTRFFFNETPTSYLTPSSSIASKEVSPCLTPSLSSHCFTSNLYPLSNNINDINSRSISPSISISNLSISSPIEPSIFIDNEENYSSYNDINNDINNNNSSVTSLLPYNSSSYLQSLLYDPYYQIHSIVLPPPLSWYKEDILCEYFDEFNDLYPNISKIRLQKLILNLLNLILVNDSLQNEVEVNKEIINFENIEEDLLLYKLNTKINSIYNILLNNTNILDIKLQNIFSLLLSPLKFSITSTNPCLEISKFFQNCCLENNTTDLSYVLKSHQYYHTKFILDDWLSLYSSTYSLKSLEDITIMIVEDDIKEEFEEEKIEICGKNEEKLEYFDKISSNLITFQTILTQLTKLYDLIHKKGYDNKNVFKNDENIGINVNGNDYKYFHLIDTPDPEGYTSLHIASCCGHLEVVKLLTDYSYGYKVSNVYLETKNKNNSLALAELNKKEDVVEYFLSLNPLLKKKDNDLSIIFNSIASCDYIPSFHTDLIRERLENFLSYSNFDVEIDELNSKDEVMELEISNFSCKDERKDVKELNSLINELNQSLISNINKENNFKSNNSNLNLLINENLILGELEDEIDVEEEEDVELYNNEMKYFTSNLFLNLENIEKDKKELQFSSLSKSPTSFDSSNILSTFPLSGESSPISPTISIFDSCENNSDNIEFSSLNDELIEDINKIPNNSTELVQKYKYSLSKTSLIIAIIIFFLAILYKFLI